MPGLKRLIIAVALTAGACPILAQPDTTPRVDTIPAGKSVTLLQFDTVIHLDSVFLFDTVVVKHTVYQLDSSTVIRKEVAELKAEFYDAALKAVERENSGIGNVFVAISIMLVIVGGAAAYSGYSSYQARKAIEREAEQIRTLRRQAESDTSHIRVKREEAEISSRTSAEAASVSGAGNQKIPFQDRIKRISEADAQKSVDLYEVFLFDMKAAGISENLVPSSLRRNVGLNYFRLDRWERTVRELKIYLQEDPTDIDALFAVAHALGELERFEEACDYWDRTTQADPEYALAFYNWGGALVGMYNATGQAKWLQAALVKCRHALEIAPDRKYYNYNLACALALLGKRDEMLVALGEAIEFESEHKKMARDDKDFKAFWEDPDFITLTKPGDDDPLAEGDGEAAVKG